jgi:hypothetical protein
MYENNGSSSGKGSYRDVWFLLLLWTLTLIKITFIVFNAFLSLTLFSFSSPNLSPFPLFITCSNIFNRYRMSLMMNSSLLWFFKGLELNRFLCFPTNPPIFNIYMKCTYVYDFPLLSRSQQQHNINKSLNFFFLYSSLF